MKINYHIHTSYSGDMIRENKLSETPERYAEAAKEKGFDEICFTEHLVIGRSSALPIFAHGMDAAKLGEYFSRILALRKKYPRPKILIGAEVDWFPDKREEIKKFLSHYPFDCILGSVHSLDGESEGIEVFEEQRDEFWKKLSPKELYGRYAKYYLAVQEMAKSGICDIVTHLDLIKRDAHLPEKDTWPLVAETIDAIAKNNLCVEVNTGGMRKRIKEMHPTLQALKLCRQKGIPVTIGTDAHKVEQIDFHLESGMKLIRDAGYTEIAVFEGRKRMIVKI